MRESLGKFWWILVTAIISASVTFEFSQIQERLAPNEVYVPDVVAKNLYTARSLLYNAGLESDTPTMVAGGIPDNIVDQDPKPTTRVKKHQTVHLTVQTGEENVVTKTLKKRTNTIPAGTQIVVALSSDIHVKDTPPPDNYEALLVNPIIAGRDVIAVKGSPVMLSVTSSQLNGSSSSIRISLKECRQVDQRTLYFKSQQQEYDSRVDWMRVILAFLGCVFTGFVITLACGGMDLGFFSLAGLFFAFIFAISIASAGRTINIPSGTRITFNLREDAISEMIVANSKR